MSSEPSVPFDAPSPPTYRYGHAGARPQGWPDPSKELLDEASPLNSPGRRLAGRYITHWAASLVAAAAACVVWILPSLVWRTSAPRSQDVTSGYALNYPYPFLVWAHILMGVECTVLVSLLMCFRRLFKLPDTKTLRARLVRGQSTWSQWLASVLDQFHDDNIEGALSKHSMVQCPAAPSSLADHVNSYAVYGNGPYDSHYPLETPSSFNRNNNNDASSPTPSKNLWLWWNSKGVVPLALITWSGIILGRYLWVESLKHTPVPFVDVVDCGFIIYLPALASFVLKEPLHGLKLISSMASFVGVYFYVFSSNPATVLEQPLTYAVRDMMIGACQSLTAALCIGWYLILYKYYNPAGWMLSVLGLQGIAAGVLGLIFLPVISWVFTKNTAFQGWIPWTWADWLSVQHYSTWTALICYCINEALRWGSPSSVSAALVLAPVLGHVLQTRTSISTESTPAVGLPASAATKVVAMNVSMNAGQITGLLLALLGCAIDALYQFGRAMKRSQRASRQQMFTAHPVVYYSSPVYAS